MAQAASANVHPLDLAGQLISMAGDMGQPAHTVAAPYGSSTNNLINTGLFAGGLAAPTGVGPAAGLVKGIIDNIAFGGLVGNSGKADIISNNPVLQRLYDSLFSSGGGTDGGSASAPTDPTTTQSSDSSKQTDPNAHLGILSQVIAAVTNKDTPTGGAAITPPYGSNDLTGAKAPITPVQSTAIPSVVSEGPADTGGRLPQFAPTTTADPAIWEQANALTQMLNGINPSARGIDTAGLPSLDFSISGKSSPVGYAPGADFMTGFGSQAGGYEGGGSYPGLRTLVR